MSYCKKCGAYIPDGQDTCLACGFDEAAEQKKQDGAAAYAYAPKSEDQRQKEMEARKRAEQRRREQQEMNRKWAESEQLRRRQQEEFRRQQEEAARRSAEWESQRKTNEDGYYRLRRNADAAVESISRSASEKRVFSYLSYVSFLCFLPSILDIKDPFTLFHAKQGRKLFFCGLIGKFLGSILGFGVGGAVIQVLQIVLMIKGMRNVSNGVMQELPVIGGLFESQGPQQPQPPQQK
ncbi:MAG: hypothetical protein IJQ43_01300 [Oscillospiraceae bacterium]|nr:hypothetical protein [Oscillospiraceae bacterium]